MPETTCLHIQDRESGPIRVVEIAGLSVRIGRAACCEVRLDDLDLGDEVCRLQRRGRTWQIIPSGPQGLVLYQGSPIDGVCSLAFDVPFRVGSSCLTLRQSRSAEPDWEMYHVPPSPRTEWPLVSAPSTPPTLKTPVTPVAANPWEARWKAAGARLLSGVDRPLSRPLPTDRPHPVPVIDRGEEMNPWKPTIVALKSNDISVRPEPARGFTPRPVGVPGVPGYPAAGSTLAGSEADLPDIPDHWHAMSPQTPRQAIHRAEPGESHPDPEVRDTVPDVAPEITTRPEGCREETIAKSDDWPELNSEAPTRGDLSALIEYYAPEQQPARAVEEAGARADVSGASTVPVIGAVPSSAESPLPGPPLRDDPFDAARVEQAWTPLWIMEPAPAFRTDTSWPQPGPPSAETERAPSMMISPSTHHDVFRHYEPSEADPDKTAVRSATLLGQPRASRRERRKPAQEDWQGTSRPGHAAAKEGGDRAEPVRPEAGFDLPSAKDILAGVPRQASATAIRASGRPDGNPAVPTVPQEPGQWLLSAWLAGPPVALLVLALGITSSMLALRWAVDSSRAAVIGQRLLAASGTPGKEKPLPEWVVPPEPSWWRTTALHLVQWGVYLNRPGSGEDARQEAVELLDGAVRISPLNPAARLARAELAATSSEMVDPARNLGLSRDAESLSWSAHCLRRAGKKEAAIGLYRQALAIAGRRDLSREPDLAFNGEQDVHRYFLPGESTSMAILRELASDTDWPCKEWLAAVPTETVAGLAAARLLHELGRPEARQLLEGMLETERTEAATDGEHALRLAMAAESHAVLSQWSDAEQKYRLAIELMDDATIKRSWWFNLAKIATQLNDDSQRKAALEGALDTVASDDISRRALELQRTADPLSKLRSGGTKAN